jgi:hypothetical protein
MSNSSPNSVEQQVKDRFGYLLGVVHWLLMDFILLNDISRYPDLPADIPGPSRAAEVKRNTTNEFQLRHLYVPVEKAIILGLFVLLYEKGRDLPNLRTLSNRLLAQKSFTLAPDSKKKFLDATEFFKDEKLYERFKDNRNNFVAHVASIEATPENQVENEHLYRLVPKAVYLAELLALELKLPSRFYDNQLDHRASELAFYFSHSEPDSLLADLFRSRSLPTADFNAKVDLFLKDRYERERFAR